MNCTRLQGPEKRLLVTGPLSSGKTTLVCAIGTEHTFRLGAARYFTLAAFQETFNAKKDPKSTPLNRLWSWQESNIVILDDLSLDLLRRIEAETIEAGSSWKDRMQDKRIVWLLADVDKVEEWSREIERIFGATPAVVVLPLPEKPWGHKPARIVAKGF